MVWWEDPQRFDPRRQRCGLHPEQLGRAAGAGDLTIGGRERRPDVVCFQLSDLCVCADAASISHQCLGGGKGRGRSRELDVESAGRRGKDSPLDHVLQFADVARPPNVPGPCPGVAS